MGKMKENPRYNVLSFRASDQEYFGIIEALNGRTIADFLLQAANEKVDRDRQNQLDAHLCSTGL